MGRKPGQCRTQEKDKELFVISGVELSYPADDAFLRRNLRYSTLGNFWRDAMSDKMDTVVEDRTAAG